MKHYIRLVAAGALVALAPFPGAAEILRIGRAAVDITPPRGMPFQVPQRPPFAVVGAQGIHDPLHAKAVVFESGGNRAAIVSCDLTSIPVRMIESARGHVAQISGVPPENVMITATHTHTGPNVRPRFFKSAPPEQMKLALDYLERLPQLIAESVREAEANLSPARLQGALGEVEGVAFNRRFFMRDGTVLSNPGKDRPELLLDIVRPAGPTDPKLPVLYLDTPDGRPLVSLINFSMHLDTTGGHQYSADFPHQLSKLLSQVKGEEMLTHFTIGAAGNINHYNLLDPERPHRVKGYEEAARIGTLLAAEVLRSYHRLEPLAAAPLKVSRETVVLAVHREKAPIIARQFGNRPEFHDGELMVKTVEDRYTFEAEVMVISLGDEVAFVGMPGEIFVELGLAVKQGSPYKYTFLNALANGTIGYVPNLKAHSEGAYGAGIASTRCDPGSGEALVESALRQLVAHREMRPTP